MSSADANDIPAAQPIKVRPASERSFASARAILALMLREMTTRYGRSPGGFVWAFVVPVASLIVLSVIFALLLRSPRLGDSFILYFASGLMVFMVYALIQGAVSGCLSFSRPLLMYPGVTWVDAVLARCILEFLTNTSVLCFVMFVVLRISETTSVLMFGPMVQAVFLMALLGLGIGTLNCAISGLFPPWTHFWGLLSRPIFLGAGVLFIYESMPEVVQPFIWYTPWIHLTGLFRSGVYPTYHPEYISLSVALAWGLGCLFLGLILLHRYHKKILME